MKKYFLMLAACLFVAAASAQTVKKYTLTFPHLDMMHIKPVVKINASVFDVPVEIENDNYDVMIYRTAKVVTREELEAVLSKNGFRLLDFKSEEQ